MKRIITIILSLAPLFASAQEHQIIGGYLLDGKDSLEELDAAVLTESRRKEKNLDEKGMRFPGLMMMNPENVGEEIGSVVATRHPFLVKTISFTVDENRMEGCKASIRIYRILENGSLENMVTMPIHQDIPKADHKTTFRIVPEENIELHPGEYYISFALTDIAQEIKDRWADSKTWPEKEKYTVHMEDRIFFPVYLKSSYCRKNVGEPLAEWKYNIGLTVSGRILK